VPRLADLDGERFAAMKETWLDVQVEREDGTAVVSPDRDLADDGRCPVRWRTQGVRAGELHRTVP
jgi:hypothetical protein